MKVLVVLCNVVLLLFTCLVLATDGVPGEPAYVALTLSLLAVPIFTVVAVLRGGAKPVWPGRFAAIGNAVLLGVVCWALVDQHPYPAEEGFLAYAVLTVVTPVLSAVVLLRAGTPRRRPAAASRGAAGRPPAGRDRARQSGQADPGAVVRHADGETGAAPRA